MDEGTIFSDLVEIKSREILQAAGGGLHAGNYFVKMVKEDGEKMMSGFAKARQSEILSDIVKYLGRGVIIKLMMLKMILRLWQLLSISRRILYFCWFFVMFFEM